MSKMLISDYDGTLKTGSNISLQLNIRAIRKFMNGENKFVISTARGFDSIKRETNKYNIPYDYLTCNNGAIIFDNRDQIIHQKTLSMGDIEDIQMVASLENLDVYFYDVYGQKGREDIVYGSIPVGFFYKNDHLEQLLSPLEVIKRGGHIFVKKKCNKLDGALVLSDYLDIDDIYAVGDSVDELELLRNCNGYKMLFSDNALNGYDIKTTTSVRSLIKKINKDKNNFIK